MILLKMVHFECSNCKEMVTIDADTNAGDGKGTADDVLNENDP